MSDKPPSKPIMIRLPLQEAEKVLTKEPPVHYSNLMTTPAMSSLGLIASALLLQHKQVTMMVSTGGNIEVVPVGELELDLLDEASALRALVERDYTNEQMGDYLRQREIRLSRNPLEGPEAPVTAPPEPKKPLPGAQSLAKVDHR